MKPTLPSAKMHLESCKGRGAGATLPSREQKCKTNNTGDSHVVTHRSTNPAITCLYMAERTGCLVLTYLWSFVLVLEVYKNISLHPAPPGNGGSMHPASKEVPIYHSTCLHRRATAPGSPRRSQDLRSAEIFRHVHCFGGDPTV